MAKIQIFKFLLKLGVLYIFCIPLVTSENLPLVRQNANNDEHEQFEQSKVEKNKDYILSQNPDCSADVQRICDKSILNNNFAVLECLQNDRKKEGSDLSMKCQNFIWNYKLELTKDARFEKATNEMCSLFIKKVPECQVHKDENGQLLSCLLDHMENASSECHSFLQKMAILVFSDYRLIYKFAEACKTDIAKRHCGRVIENNNLQASHSQGETIECLSKDFENLSKECSHEILRIGELQGEDFHLDRPLYFACREDRERFCSKVPSGDGRVYKCLMRHRNEREMSQECKEKIYRREKLVAHDYKVNRKLAKACRENIKQYRCREDTSNKREIRLAQILLCLENMLHKGFPIAGECQAEMLEHRRSLMENYQLTPELATACSQDVADYCPNTKFEGTLHCLMEHARMNRNGQHISTSCNRELERLIKVSDVGEDWRVDPVLQQSCQGVVDNQCSHIQPGEGRVLSCLMDHIDYFGMNMECREKLLEIQYFMARDFKLDPMLYKRCHKEAVKHCHAKKDWHDKPSNMDPERGPIVLPCLYRYAYHPDENVKLSRECLYEVKRVMRQRAISVDLHPEIEGPCLQDMAKFCNENIGRGEEITCLQKDLDKLSTECHQAVFNYTVEEAEHLELNYPIFQACHSVIQKLCPDQLAQDVDQGDLLQCLIAHKNEPEMKQNQRCRISVEHFQLLSLKDFRFSPKFKIACKNDVLSFCKKIKTKWEVVACLSNLLTSDLLFSRKKPPRISKECRNQLKVELLQRDENIHFNVKVDKDCKEDQKQFCSNVSPGEGQILECLKNHKNSLSSECHKAIFQVEKEEMADNSVDYALVTTCKGMIKKYCSSEDMSQVLECLKEHRREHGMDPKCHKLIIKRMLEQNTDYRLNVRLQKACSSDIPKFCRSILDKYQDDTEFEGRVITCLKKYNRQDLLSLSCKEEIVTLIKDINQNFQLDPVLTKACESQMKNCSQEINPEECLRQKFRNREIHDSQCNMAIASWISDSRADIQSDSLLYKACSLDLKHYCSDVVPGHGRHLSCLLAILESEHTLAPECKATLSRRVQMFEYAAQMAPIETPGEIIAQIANSPSRNYLLVSLFGMLALIFIGGLLCGRVTKRIPDSVKNK